MVSREQRHTRAHRCSICGGADEDPRGRGKRCSGYTSDDGLYVNCSREDYAGALAADDNGLYGHFMRGECKCGTTHVEAPARSGNIIEATYDYKDKDGKLVFQVVKYPKTAKKPFSQRRPDGSGGWIWNMQGVTRIIYRLPEILASDGDIFIVEGEKDVGTLVKRGFEATTNPGGAGKWKYVEVNACDVLRGKSVTIIADADEPGRRHAIDVAKRLSGVAKSITLLEPPYPQKDVTELLEEGGSLDDLVALQGPTVQEAPSPPDSPPPPPPPSPAMSSGPQIQLTMDRGQPAKTAGNVARYLLQHPDWNGGPQYDTYSQFVLWPDPVPPPVRGISRTHREVVSADRVVLQSWLMQQPDAVRVRVGTEVVREAIQSVAAANSIDLLKQWTESWPEWDRVPRLDGWLATYLGCEDNLYTRSTGRGWLIAVVHRAICPGVHVDVIPVLEGVGGAGKNRTVETLFQGGPEWSPWVVTVSGLNLDKDETKRLACTRWILQDDELQSASSRRIEALKSWSSRTMETYRIPYMPDITSAKRRGLLIGSIDRDTYLHDDNVRRWWPWKIEKGRILFDRLEKERLQLFAEALYCVRQGGEGWRTSITEDAFGEARVEAEKRRVGDPLYEQVEKLLSGPQAPAALNSSEIGKSLGYGVESVDRSFATRLGNVMRELGYSRYRPRSGEGRGARIWVK